MSFLKKCLLQNNIKIYLYAVVRIILGILDFIIIIHMAILLL